MPNELSVNLRRLRLSQQLTQEQAAQRLGVSAQSVSRWETATTLPDVMLLPDIARLYGVLVDDLFRPAPKGYANNALRLLAVFERTHSPEDFLAAAKEFDRIIQEGSATADDWRSCGVTHEYMVYQCIERAISCYDKAMELSRAADGEMYHRALRQKTLLRSRTGQNAACVAELEAALRDAPDDPGRHADLAHALACGDHHARALAVCEEALRHCPDDALLHILAGDACRALRRPDDAFPHWEAALRLDDRFSDALFSMAFCREELGQFAEAADTWDEIVRRLTAQGLEIEAKWPREMAAKARARANDCQS